MAQVFRVAQQRAYSIAAAGNFDVTVLGLSPKSEVSKMKIYKVDESTNAVAADAVEVSVFASLTMQLRYNLRLMRVGETPGIRVGQLLEVDRQVQTRLCSLVSQKMSLDDAVAVCFSDSAWSSPAGAPGSSHDPAPTPSGLDGKEKASASEGEAPSPKEMKQLLHQNKQLQEQNASLKRKMEGGKGGGPRNVSFRAPYGGGPPPPPHSGDRDRRGDDRGGGHYQTQYRGDDRGGRY